MHSSRLLTIVAAAAVVVGLLWIGQGTGVTPWPASSFMINDRQWAVRGGVVAALGVVGLFLGFRRKGDRA